MVTLIAGVYQFIRYLVQNPGIFHEAEKCLGPQSLHKWRSAKERWSDLSIDVVEIDDLIETSASNIVSREDLSSYKRRIINLLHPHCLINIQPPDKRIESVLRWFMHDVSKEEARRFIAEVSSSSLALAVSRLPDKAIQDFFKKFALSKVEMARQINELILSALPVLYHACRIVLFQWAEEDKSREAWTSVLLDCFSLGADQLTIDWVYCRSCLWTMRREEFNQRFIHHKVCPNCGKRTNYLYKTSIYTPGTEEDRVAYIQGAYDVPGSAIPGDPSYIGNKQF